MLLLLNHAEPGWGVAPLKVASMSLNVAQAPRLFQSLTS
jgi:hypothetical protein